MPLSRNLAVQVILAFAVLFGTWAAIFSTSYFQAAPLENRGDVQKIYKFPQVNQEPFPKEAAPVGVVVLPNGIAARMQQSPLWNVSLIQRVFFAVIYLALLLAVVVWYLVGWSTFTHRRIVWRS